MSQPVYDLAAMGDALVDVLAHADEGALDSLCAQFSLNRNAYTLVDEATALAIYDRMGPGLESSGGSASNTMAGFASFGGKGAFIGKVADDTLGQVFRHDLTALGVHFETEPLAMGAKTGRCLILVAPDGQRTMAVLIGAAAELGPDDVEEDVIASAGLTYLEGYLFDRPQNKAAFARAAEIAHAAGHRVALSLSDPFCVDAHRHDFIQLVQHHVDILFANEDEIKSLFLCDDFESAASAVNGCCDIAVLTRGPLGAVILSGKDKAVVPAAGTTRIVDTTGAGDQFAAGFLYGLTRGMPLQKCGRLGTLAAAEVISHMGPRPEIRLSDLLKAA